MPSGLLCLLMGCGGSIKSVEPPQLAAPPTSLTVVCARPVQLPDRVLTQEEIEWLWSADRSNLITCGEIHQALRDYYSSRDAKIMGEF